MEPNRYVLKLLVGIVSLQLLIKYLKSYIKEERPVKSKTYGMPSSKAATLGFIVTYMLLNHVLKLSTQLLVLLSFIVGLYMKYHLNEHTPKQLIVGGMIGCVYASLVYKL
jgi:acid phosphatase family membrane protein YuiD